jgi:hypothetical protein
MARTARWERRLERALRGSSGTPLCSGLHTVAPRAGGVGRGQLLARRNRPWVWQRNRTRDCGQRAYLPAMPKPSSSSGASVAVLSPSSLLWTNCRGGSTVWAAPPFWVRHTARPTAVQNSAAAHGQGCAIENGAYLHCMTYGTLESFPVGTAGSVHQSRPAGRSQASCPPPRAAQQALRTWCRQQRAAQRDVGLHTSCKVSGAAGLGGTEQQGRQLGGALPLPREAGHLMRLAVSLRLEPCFGR